MMDTLCITTVRIISGGFGMTVTARAITVTGLLMGAAWFGHTFIRSTDFPKP